MGGVWTYRLWWRPTVPSVREQAAELEPMPAPQKTEEAPRASRHPEIFWVLFTVVAAAVLLAVVEPAWRESSAAEERIREVRQRAAEHQAYLDDLRATRQALEAGDKPLWEAIARENGMTAPEEVNLNNGRKGQR